MLVSPSVLHCPSTGGTSNSYAGCHHDSAAPIDVDNNGVLFLNSSIRLRDITDGKSQTLLVGEGLSLAFGGWYQGTEATLRYSGGSMEGAGTMDMTAYWQEIGRRESQDPTEAETAQTPITSTPLPFGSIHSGGAHFALADGAVRFISSSIDGGIMRRLGNRHDGEVTGQF
jgi:prepilin-type processing-associated H-X9-DG protein